MDKEFKVGDKVKCIDVVGSLLSKEVEYLIHSIRQCGLLDVYDARESSWTSVHRGWNVDRFELVDAVVFIPEGDTFTKETNPKESVGIKKPAMSTVSGVVMAELGVGMMEGARKYGRHNYRDSGIKASVYYDATMRHMMAWWEGEDIDPDSKLSHVTKAICSLVVLRDAMIQDTFSDDRPPKSPEDHKKYLQTIVDEIFVKYPDSLPAITAKRV